MSSGHYCDNCHQNQYNCDCSGDPKLEKPTIPADTVNHETDFLNGWRETIQRVFSSKATRSNTRVPMRSKDAYGLPFEEHSAGAVGQILELRRSEQPYRFTDINRTDLSNVGPDLSDMPDHYPRKKLVGTEKPLKLGWNCVSLFKPPSGKLQFYTIGGTCIFGEFASIAPGFVTHWSHLLPSPSKQAGRIK